MGIDTTEDYPTSKQESPSREAEEQSFRDQGVSAPVY